ncbi:sugar transporter [Campylobacter concisus]|uniref:Sugar transporter n=1 Tax=Campylobacter concisus TaxID=199 RepID=A0A7S9S9I5_9BACT|nr:sugar transporter [Campylobacter concisus]QPI06005.1 sugar transporter [Campylobacter concisus]
MINIHKIAYLRVIALAFAAFIFNTTEFVPVPLLSDIAKDFGMSTADTGLIITIYAWSVTILSLPFMLLTANLERRSLLLKVFIIFVASHALCAVAWNFTVLVIARVLIAISHAIFWSITASLAVRVAPINKSSQALGLLALGTSMAMILGLPLGRILGDSLGWRVTFGLIGIFAVGVGAWLYKILPLLPSKNSGSLKSLPELARNGFLMVIFLLTAIVISAHFSTYSYIEPFAKDISSFDGKFITIFLLLFGVAGIVASMLFSKFYKLIPNAFTAISIAIILACLLTLNFIATNESFMLALAFIWGLGIAGINMSFQIKVLSLASNATDAAMAIYSAIYNIGIGAGALIGHQTIVHLGEQNIGNVGSLFAAAGLVIFLVAAVKFKKAK